MRHQFIPSSTPIPGVLDPGKTAINVPTFVEVPRRLDKVAQLLAEYRPPKYGTNYDPFLAWCALAIRCVYSRNGNFVRAAAAAIGQADVVYSPDPVGLFPQWSVMKFGDATVIAMGGLSNPQQGIGLLLTNLIWVNTDYAGKVFGQFETVATALRQTVLPLSGAKFPWIFAAHSYGGGLAQVFNAWQIAHANDVSTITFGAPKVGYANFQRVLANTPYASVVAVLDPVPNLPPNIWGQADPDWFPPNAAAIWSGARPGRAEAFIVSGQDEPRYGPAPDTLTQFVASVAARLVAGTGQPGLFGSEHELRQYFSRLRNQFDTWPSAELVGWIDPGSLDQLASDVYNAGF